MQTNFFKRSTKDLRRKLQGVAAVVKDPGATEHEKANAQALKARLEQRLRETGAPAGNWTDSVFRLGKMFKQIRKSTAPALPKGDWTDTAHWLGKALRRGRTKLSPDR